MRQEQLLLKLRELSDLTIDGVAVATATAAVPSTAVLVTVEL